VSEIAVEYLLGATKAIAARFAHQTIAARETLLKAEASTIASLVTSLFERHGWIIQWSDHGRVSSIAKRWGETTLLGTLKKQANVDLGERQVALRDRAARLRTFLTQGEPDSNRTAAPRNASKAVIDLKELRHKRSEDLRVLRRQQSEQVGLLSNIEHRLHSARDILRLKKEGIGRIELVECPTCHRSVDPTAFQLTAQSTESVEAHIQALERDRSLVRSNANSAEQQIIRVSADLLDVENRLREAERALGMVNESIGASREQFTKAATDLIAVEGEMDRIAETSRELLELQTRIDGWIAKTGTADVVSTDGSDLKRRLTEFTGRLRLLLQALGHGAILAQSASELRLDEQYIPYLGEKHRNLFIDFLISGTARDLKVQTIVFTWLQEPELNRLIASGVRIIDAPTEHFLTAVSPAAT
jgi:DNA repair exonuclease SbcCD ATPase subunit